MACCLRGQGWRGSVRIVWPDTSVVPPEWIGLDAAKMIQANLTVKEKVD